MVEEIDLKPGDYLMREGEDSTEMYLLKQGTMEVIKTKGTEDKQIGTIYAGELVGEMSFLDRAPRSASVRAIGECKVNVIPSEKFEKVLEELPSWMRALMNTLLDRLRKANSRVRV